MSRLGMSLLACLAAACGAEPQGPEVPGVFVLGVDGMDPVILSRLMHEGRMPNFQQLADEGTFQHLGTSTPPQSPVAWSSFITGMDPGGHGIYDFVHRDPATYHPVSSATPLAPEGEEPSALKLGGYYLPIGGGEILNNRAGTPFWDLLHAAGVDTEVYRIPGNYPTPPSEAKVLGGMGTVDMRGGYGTYTWYTDVSLPKKHELKGDVQVVTVRDSDLDGNPDKVISTLKGPPDLFHLPPGQEPGDDDYLSVQVTVSLDPEEDVALVQVGDSRALVQEGQWTDWMEVNFEGLPMHLADMSGIVRFYAKQLRPSFQLYASPVNIWAAAPAQPIASGDEFAEEIHEKIGSYYTQGLPEETNALKDGLFDDDDYLSQVALVQQETLGMLDMALARFERGDMTFVYMSDLDLQCHMLWRHGDPKYLDAPPHPAWDEEAARKHADAIEQLYEHVDRTLGEVRQRLPEEALLLVMSDHGFLPQTRSFHLNAWLRDHGWLVLKEGARTGHIVKDEVDWSKTRAYGVGFNGLFLNLQGREAHGIVKPAEADVLARDLARQLSAWIDPDTGASAIKRVDLAREVYSGERVDEAPDLVVGYDKGYACSDESTLGEITELVVEDNTSRWSGNHLGAPEIVPGVLLLPQRLDSAHHDLTDITVTILEHYGLQPGPGMVGESIFSD